MASRVTRTVTLGPQGRLVIPATVRDELGLTPGSVLVARVENGQLTLEPRRAALARLQSRYRKVPAGVSLADELIEERRREARRESR